MKLKLIFLALVLLSTQAYCQLKNNFSLVYGAGLNTISSIGIGGPGYEGKVGKIYGFNYSRNITKVFSIETGLEYSVNNVLRNFEDAYNPYFTPQKGSIKMLSVPIYANFTFLKYLFADAGIIADFETNYYSNSITPKQSGIGINVGTGYKFNFNKIFIFVNSFLQVHSVIAFQNDDNSSLINLDAKFGIGYRF
ncbi:outer membrane beta-barrel protein [Mucilaginibacter sp. McL0603]|uniref:outer membrane beta-barrel protein n=1 Tax=Mucilaginibacter sp. McL0603 TaxID=3415670 RepID=UPI003CEC00B4